ncbi:MAG: LptF/LptG family permease [Deltaproteobacteria bacterium]|nr:LptF/LptG family permease [Deltaproteobacteria bacterium]MBW2392961.1 LptF/LptG family permease [Deltaproteobacteria bacterium]
MRIPRTLSLYVLRELGQYAGIGLLAVGSVMLSQRILRELNDIAGIGIGFGDMLNLMAYLLGMLAAYSIPVAFLFGILVAVGRLSSDAEVTAMRALGVSLGQIVAPVAAVGLVVALCTGWLLSSVEPGARRDLRGFLGEVASRGGIIEPGAFNELDTTGQRLLFVDGRNEQNELTGVLISDRTDPVKPFTVVANRGHFEFQRDTGIGLIRLFEGDIHFEREDAGDDRYQRISFKQFEYAFDLSALATPGLDRIRPREMSNSLIQQILSEWGPDDKAPRWVRVKSRNRYEIQLHRRLALPVAPLLFALIGVPLGLQRSRGARSWGVLICVVLVFSYYTLLSAGEYLAQEELAPAAVSLWLPNLVFAAVAAFLLHRARHAEI